MGHMLPDLAHAFFGKQFEKSLSEAVSFLDTNTAMVTVTWDVTGPKY